MCPGKFLPPAKIVPVHSPPIQPRPESSPTMQYNTSLSHTDAALGPRVGRSPIIQYNASLGHTDAAHRGVGNNRHP